MRIEQQIAKLAIQGKSPLEIAIALRIHLIQLRILFHKALQEGYKKAFLSSLIKEPQDNRDSILKTKARKNNRLSGCFDRLEYDRQRAKDFYRQQKEKASEGDPVALERIAKAKAMQKAWRQKNKDRVNLYNRKYLALLQERAENGDKEAIEVLDRRKASMQKAHKKQRRNPKNDMQHQIEEV